MSYLRWRRPVLYTLPLVIFPKMKHHLRGRCAVLEGDLQPLGHHELDSNVLKTPLLYRHTIHVSKLVLL